MRKIHFYLGGSLMLGTLFGGCTVPGTDEKPKVVVAPVPVTTPAIIVTPVPQVVANPGLIQSTNPNDRLKQIKISNKDPFAANQPTALIVTNTPIKESGSSGTVVATNPALGSGSERLSISTTTSSGQETTSVTVESGSGNSKTGRQLVRANSGKKSVSVTNSTGVATGSKSQKVAANSKNASSRKPASSKNSSVTKKNTQTVKSSKTGSTASNSSSTSVNQPFRPSVPVIPNDDNSVAINPGVLPGNSSVEPSIPDTPSVPQLASQVEVRGVVELDNGYSYAIVRGPNEKSSANVSQGDTVPNTGILVKRIEVDRNGGKMSGMVILEENGLEVFRPVGEKVASAGDETQSTQGGANAIPNDDAPPVGHDNGNSGTQPFNTPTAQPVSTPTSTVAPSPIQSPGFPSPVVPSPIQSPGFSSPTPSSSE